MVTGSSMYHALLLCQTVRFCMLTRMIRLRWRFPAGRFSIHHCGGRTPKSSSQSDGSQKRPSTSSTTSTIIMLLGYPLELDLGLALDRTWRYMRCVASWPGFYTTSIWSCLQRLWTGMKRKPRESGRNLHSRFARPLQNRCLHLSLNSRRTRYLGT